MSATEGIGSFLSFSTALPATETATAYAALAWKDFNQAGDVPEFGPENEVVTFTPVKSGIVNKFHGEIDYGSLSISGALDDDDPAQPILRAARKSKDELAMKATYSDGRVQYCRVKIFAFRSGFGVSGVVPLTVNIEIISEVIDVAP